MSMFAGISYYLSPSFPLERQDELQNVLNANGAQEVDPSSATYVITNSLDFDGAFEVQEGTQFVTDQWVDRSLIFGKLQSPPFYSPDPNMIFSGMVACSSDLPPSDNEVLCAGIMARGGQWRNALTREVTHLFAYHPGSDKYEAALAHPESGIKILLPHWFDDCFKLDACLPTEAYEWPDPPLFARETEIDKRRPGRGQVGGASFATDDSDDVGARVRMRKDVWQQRKVLLSPRLALKLDSLRTSIERAGGIVLNLEREDRDAEEEMVDECDVLVTNLRQGSAFLKAFRLHKTIGTVSWAFNVSANGRFTAPTDHLLHYPKPARPADNFDKHIITVTNYTGEARDYLKTLIELMGGEWTAGMSGRNTVVIAAYFQGTKTDKARQWSIPIVNHTWLEDCYVAWRALTPALPKYIHFPNNVDFAGTVGAKKLGHVTLTQADIEASLDPQPGFDDEQAMDVEQMDVDGDEEEEDVRRPSPRKLKMMPSMAASAADALEVESVVTVEHAGLDPDMHMDVDGKENEPPRSPAKRSKKVTSAKPSPGSSAKKPRSTSKGKAKSAAHVSEDDDDEVQVVEEDGPAPKGRSRRKKVPVASTSKPATKPGATRKAKNNDSEDEDDEEWEVEDEPGPSTRSRRVNGRSPHTMTKSKASTKPAPKANSKPVSKGKGKADPRWVPSMLQDNLLSDDEEEEKEVAPPRGRRRPERHVTTEEEDEAEEEEEPEPVKKSKAKQAAAAEATVDAKKGSTSLSTSPPKRTVSVLIERSPALAKKQVSPKTHASPLNVDPIPRALERTHSVQASAGQQTGTPGRRGTASGSGSAVPASSRRAATPSENEDFLPPSASVQRTPSRRQAAAKATQRLRDVIMPDVVNFQKQMRTGSVKGTWETGGESLPTSAKENRKKRRSSGATAAVDESELSDGDDTRVRKKQKTETETKSRSARLATADTREESDRESSSEEIKLLITQEKVTDAQIKTLQKLGIKMATKASECTHLIAPKIARTEKFLCALAVSPYILSVDWAKACIKAQALLPEEEFFLVDREGEKKHAFKLTDALKRAKRRRVFEGKTFYCTPKVKVEYALLKNVVQAGGGTMIRMTQSVGVKSMQSESKYVISVGEDKSIWRNLADAGKPIYGVELVLDCALRQEFNVDREEYTIAR